MVAKRLKYLYCIAQIHPFEIVFFTAEITDFGMSKVFDKCGL